MSETNPEPAQSTPETLLTSTLLPSTFRFGQVLPILDPTTAPLGPLVAFTGTFTGNGFNTIFRPNLGSPTQGLPNPPVGPDDNLLELNLTSETLSFAPPLGSVPNRGEIQPDIFLNGLPYQQSIEDITALTINPTALPTGIHLEPGLWMSVPATTAPAEGPTLVRMASIPHGTTICAQGTAQTIDGPPDIPAVDITPFTPPDNKVPPGTFPSQTAAQDNTWRIPQDLTPYIAAGQITQAILDDPNTVLRNVIAGQRIASTTIISIATNPAAPLFGGGTDNIAFLLGNQDASTPNAQSVQMTATFWIETVVHEILIPPIPFPGGERPPTIATGIPGAGRPVTTFVIDPPIPILNPRPIFVTSTQIQYSQTVLLNFNGLLWPHVSVATLVPAGPVSIPPSGWAALLKEPL
jgi:hypothetical protein